MYGLQTAPSPRRTNCKFQRNIKYKEDNFGGGGGEILDENVYWNSHNNSHPHPYPHRYSYPWCYPYPCFSNAAQGSLFPLQSYSKKALRKNVPKSARKYKLNVLMPPGHPI